MEIDTLPRAAALKSFRIYEIGRFFGSRTTLYINYSSRFTCDLEIFRMIYLSLIIVAAIRKSAKSRNREFINLIISIHRYFFELSCEASNPRKRSEAARSD